MCNVKLTRAPPLKNWHHRPHGPVVLGVYQQPSTTHCRTILQNWQNKAPKASPEEQPIMENLPGLPEDTKSLRGCSGNRVKMLLKGNLGIKCHAKYS